MGSNVKHGHARKRNHSSTYKIWLSMLDRCRNPNNKAFHHYGGRGITVCKRWLRFENFLADMGEKPVNLSLDRVNNDRGYGPKNCRWATKREQLLNTRQTHFLTFRGETHPVVIWCEKLGLNEGLVRSRLSAGWSAEDALGLPNGGPGKGMVEVRRQRAGGSIQYISHGGERLTLFEWERRLGMTDGTIRGRLLRGWDPERAVTTPAKKKPRKKK